MLIILPAVKVFFVVSRPWDLSHLIGADFLSILPHRMVKIDEYVSGNEFLTFDLHYRICIDNYKLLVANAAPAGALFSVKSTSQDLWNMPFLDLVKFHQLWGPKGSQGVPACPIY